MTNPFATTAPKTEVGAAPQAAPAAPVAAAPVAAAPAAATTAPVEGEKKERKKPNRQMRPDERKYVIENYYQMSTSQMASEMGLTRQQVYRTVHESRKVMKERAAAATESGDTATAKKIEDFIAKFLPEKPFGGSGNTRGSSIDSVVDDLLAGL